jgi:hypothetical protein
MKKKINVDIEEYYKDFSCPFSARHTIKDLLLRIPEKYYETLGKITLTNSNALNRKIRRKKSWHREKKYHLGECRGWYGREWRGKPAQITILVDNTIKVWPNWVLMIPFIRNLIFAEVFFHELGHHIHSTMAPEYNEKEDVADNWRKKLGRLYLRTRYWYLIIFFWPFIIYRKVKKIFS